MTKLRQLHDLHGQSPWLDNFTRGDLTGGRLGRLVARGVRGVTSNPTIIAKAIGGSADYDRQLAALAASGHDAEASYCWSPTTSSRPWPCCDRCTTAAAGATGSCRWSSPGPCPRHPGQRGRRPGAAPAHRRAQPAGQDPGHRRGRARGRPGQAGLPAVPGPFQRPPLAGPGRPRRPAQRLLWASTSTKNPAYPDTVYVDSLIGRDTITTLPEATIAAFEDHGTLAATLPDGVPDAHASLQRLAAVGIRLPEVAAVLEAQGVAAFAKSYDELLSLLRSRVVEMPSAGRRASRPR